MSKKENLGNMLGEKIKKLRTSRNWTTRALAERIGTAQGMIPRYESGEAVPRAGVIEKLAKAFGVPLADLVNEKPVELTGEKFDAKRFERSIIDLRQLDEHSKTLVSLLIDELIEKKKLKDYHAAVNQMSNKL